MSENVGRWILLRWVLMPSQDKLSKCLCEKNSWRHSALNDFAFIQNQQEIRNRLGNDQKRLMIDGFKSYQFKTNQLNFYNSPKAFYADGSLRHPRRSSLEANNLSASSP